MSFKEKVKALLEEKSKPSPEERGKAMEIKHKALVAKALGSKESQTEVPKELGNLPGFAKVVFHHKALRRATGAPKKGLGPPPINFPKKSQTENSNHPFYQKVKALSRGKKNNSLLERKSKIIKVLIARIKPCEKKVKDG